MVNLSLSIFNSHWKQPLQEIHPSMDSNVFRVHIYFFSSFATSLTLFCSLDLFPRSTSLLTPLLARSSTTSRISLQSLVLVQQLPILDGSRTDPWMYPHMKDVLLTVGTLCLLLTISSSLIMLLFTAPNRVPILFGIARYTASFKSG